MQAQLGSVTLADAPSFTAGSQFCLDVDDSGEQYELEEITAPGVNGVGVKNHGYRGRKWAITGQYVGASISAAYSAANGDAVGLGASLFSLVVGGVTFPNCQLERAIIKPDGGGFNAGVAIGFALATFIVVQRSKA